MQLRKHLLVSDHHKNDIPWEDAKTIAAFAAVEFDPQGQRLSRFSQT